MHVATYLLFQGNAEEALHFYQRVFRDTEITAIHHYPRDAGEMAGKLLPSRLRIGDHQLMLADSPNPHDFTFTPSTSIYINFENEEELIEAHDILCEDGDIMMPLDDYGFSEMFAWLNDKFGVSWQLNLP
ncbi:MAG: hypothetical protein CMK06_10070 [Ponticaulis sp.]|nr:hypothetical protein [Ponticaulis sp.]|tara:strand:+ start:26334 stop:26723 length:390 start_codon:yes stop_codon:yes gene_type:complete